MERISENTTKELRYILEGIRDGRLQHKQESYHCGTAHCVAGWKEVLDVCKIETKKSFFKVPQRAIRDMSKDIDTLEEKVEDLEGKLGISYIDTPFGYATKVWGLTKQEAYKLFSAEAKLKNQFKVLEKLEAGYRHYDDKWRKV